MNSLKAACFLAPSLIAAEWAGAQFNQAANTFRYAESLIQQRETAIVSLRHLPSSEVMPLSVVKEIRNYGWGCIVYGIFGTAVALAAGTAALKEQKLVAPSGGVDTLKEKIFHKKDTPFEHFKN